MSTCNGKTSDCEVITAVEIDTITTCYTNEGFDSSENGLPVVQVKSPLDATFVMVNRNVLPKSDFSEEVRAKLDAKHYFQQMIVQLDVSTINFSQIVNNLLAEMLGPSEKVAEARKIIFLDKEETTFATALQGTLEDQKDKVDPTWIIGLASLPGLNRKQIGIARLRSPLTVTIDASSVYFVILVISPSEEKVTKSAVETSRIIGTLFSDGQIRHELRQKNTPEGFKEYLVAETLEQTKAKLEPVEAREPILSLGADLWENIRRRSKFYLSDFKDGLNSLRAINKLLSTTLFLFFSILFPAVAFGQLAAKNTEGKIDVDKAVIGQIIGGLLWAFFAGQPMLIIATTALVSLYSLVVFNMSKTLDTDFYALYAWVGIWSTVFIAIYSFFGISNLIKYSTRSVEEVFASFITICFALDAIKDIVLVFQNNYNLKDGLEEEEGTHKAICLLSLILMIGTVTLSVFAYNFRSTPFLVPFIRNFISDYALPIGVIAFSIIAYFTKINVEKLHLDGFKAGLTVADLSKCDARAIGVSVALGFAVSVLFFMDENITSMIINAPTNKMKKGGAPHLDILCIGVINCILSFYGLPWMHAVLPHSPLHVVCMAETEEQTIGGITRNVIVKARETRVSGIISHILIGLIFGLAPKIFGYIPVAVLNGLFLYCAIASTRGSSFVERILLVLTQQSQYPPAHYVRRVRQRVIHLFTLLELLQLGMICFVGFYPETYLQMTFPVFIAILIPIRHLIVPLFIDKRYIKVLDSFE